jgi:hypothetical protein
MSLMLGHPCVPNQAPLICLHYGRMFSNMFTTHETAMLCIRVSMNGITVQDDADTTVPTVEDREAQLLSIQIPTVPKAAATKKAGPSSIRTKSGGV